jgi:hypothetical protein
MRLFISIILIVLLGLSSKKNYAGNYHLQEDEIEAAFLNSQDITTQYLLMLNSNMFSGISTSNLQEDNTQMVAGIIAIASFFIRWGSGVIGWIPIVGWATWGVIWIATIIPWHRIYLKTAGNDLKIVALYCVTLGWCINAHHVIDGIFLLMDGSNNKYVNNPKYVMWAN